jgi:trk system potassium uptake protein TrkA
MVATKRFIVLGLGTFGTALATRLHASDCRVTGVDLHEDRVEDLRDILYEAVIGDSTDREVLLQLNLPTATAVFISLGEDIARSLLATLHCRELGAKRMIVRGVTPDHGRILKHLGVERVVFPETEAAVELADREAYPNVLDFLPIDPEYSLVEIATPEAFSGQTIGELDLRRRFGVWVVGVKDVLTGKLEMLPNADYRLHEDHLLLAIGKHAELNRLRQVK